MNPRAPTADNDGMKHVRTGAARIVLAWIAMAWIVAGCGSSAPVSESRVDVAPASGERTITIEVGGMICQDCADKVQRSLADVPGVRGATVSLDDRRAIVVAEANIPDTALTGAVRRAGPGYLGLVQH